MTAYDMSRFELYYFEVTDACASNYILLIRTKVFV